MSSESVKLIAEVNPESEPGEKVTECSFEYVSETAYQENVTHGADPFAGASVVPASGGVLAANFEVDTVSARTQDLLAGTGYRYRVVVANARGVSEGQRGEKGEEVPQSFTTQSVGGELVLADGREWEMVTPPDKHGALFSGLNQGLNTNGDGASVVQASADGGAIAVMSDNPVEAEPRGFDNLVSVLSARGIGGWSSRVLTPPHDEASAVSLGNGGEYRLFSEDLSEAVVQPFGGFTPLSPAASEPTAYLRADYAGGSASGFCSESCYRPLVSGCPRKSKACAASVAEHADVPAGTVFGETTNGRECPYEVCGPEFVGASPDLDYVVLQSAHGAPYALTEGAPPGGLYEWAGGKLSLIGTGHLAGTRGVGETVNIEKASYVASRTVSNDDGRVVFNGSSEGLSGLLLRDPVLDETVQIGGSGAEFMGASSDASLVFYLEGGISMNTIWTRRWAVG